MGFYDRYIVPRMNDMMASGPEADAYRKRVLSSARGRVLEVGFGTGLNAAHYPSDVSHVTALDPNPGVEKLAHKRIAAARVPIDLRRGSGSSLPFDDHSFDTVVTTLVLCSIDDVHAALAEIRRVLAPDGLYLLMEHGLADDPGVRRWQHRLNSLQMLVAGGCRINRDMRPLIEGAGFRFEDVEQFYYPKAPRPAAFTTLGRATVAEAA
ncbi:MAG: class I SAM-dependent methyltransferase [Deltaproteobacteria bacterium]|nr:class I SAM-dependent methyltransferase [Deltaproteobacteria bacterium]